MLSTKLLRNIGYLFLVSGLLMLGVVGWVFFDQLQVRQTLASTSSSNVNTEPFATAASESSPGSSSQNIIENRSNTLSAAGQNAVALSSAVVAESGSRSVVVETEVGRESYQTDAPNVAAFLDEINLTLYPSDKIYADGELLQPFNLEQVPLPEELSVGRFVSLTVIDEGFTQVIRTAEETVEAALIDAQITLFEADITKPAADSAVFPDMEITIQRSIPIVIQVDGEIIQTRTIRKTASAVLADEQIALVGTDFFYPADADGLEPNGVIEVVRVTEDFRTEDIALPFETVWQGTDQLGLDEKQQLQAGVAGTKQIRYRIRYENGKEVSQVADGEWIVQEPQNEIMGYGTRVDIRVLNTESGPVEYYRVVKMRVTSYMAQTSGKPADHPAYGITASGVIAGYGVVAIDPKVVPFRSNVYVPGYGQGFAGDTGGGVKGRWIDLGYEDDWDTFEHWSGYVDVYYLTPVPETITYLLPTTLP